MIDRRSVLAGASALLCAPSIVTANPAQNTRLPRRFRMREVDVNPALPAGVLIVKQSEFHLYWTLGEGRALRYGIALGAEGRNFSGDAVIARKAEWPSWKPTQNMINLEPELYGPYKDGLPGGHPMNPMGSAALYMYVNGQDTFYRVHGTPFPHMIGQGWSSGCVKLRNDDMDDLFQRVPVGTRISVQT